MNKPLAQRSILRMMIARLEERPSLLSDFEFLHRMVVPPGATVSNESEEEAVQMTLDRLREIVSD